MTSPTNQPETARSSVLQGYVDFCVEHITAIVQQFGPRPPASDAETRAQRYLADLLRPFAAEVQLEPFSVAPKAFMGFVPITGGLLLAAVAVYALVPALALLCVVGALALAVGELGLYRQLIDPLFPHATSHNLVATIPPRGPVERILLFGGHCDSAWEWRWHYLGHTAFRVIVGGAVVGAVIALGATLLNLVAPASRAALALGWVLVAFSPFFLLLMGFTNFRRVSPGANDNLTGVLLSVALAKHLHDQGRTLEHTEIRILNTGSEEAGLRGARAYAERHREELAKTPSLYVAVDTFRDLEHMAVYDRDLNGFLRHDPDAAKLLAEAARRAGHPLPLRALPLGATDAAAFTKAGLRAIALLAMDPAPPRWYHTRLDTPELLKPECIEAGLRVMLELIRTVDSEGLGAGS
jgi:hypothetical protein